MPGVKMSIDKKSSILKKYASLSKRLKREVRLADLKEIGITKDMVSHHFGSLSALDANARAELSSSFFDVSIESIYTPKNLSSLRSDVANHKRFVVTTAVNGCKIHEGFYAAIKNYCAINNATLLVLVASDPAHSYTHGNKDWGTIDARLQTENIVFEDTKLNNNIFLSTIKIAAKHIDPITGLGRIGQRNGSFIYASPKQRLKAVAVSNNKLPHFLMTTGAITKPDYASDLYLSQRTAYIAEHDHVIGAIIVEVEDEETFHFRQIQADTKGDFADLGVMYSANYSKDYLPEAFILGDWHTGSTDPEARSCWEQVSKALRPKQIILHDLFDGRSISHHEEKDQILRAQRAGRNELSLSNELEEVASDLSSLLTVCQSLVVVKSNHDQFLERYLREGRYAKDPLNHKLSLQLAYELLEGEDPLKAGVEIFLDDASADKINWLSMDEDYKIAGVQLGAHGHAGSNGARGSLAAMEQAYSNSISGHAHTPEILRNCVQVGTSSYLKMSYVKGASSWLHSSALLYPNGTRQLINCINGKWRLED
jgi:hypothetical protein